MFFRMVYNSGQIFLPFCHNTRMWQTDGQTDGQTDRRTEFSSQYRVCITCSAVKTEEFFLHLLVMNTNLPSILHRFQVRADYYSQIFASDRGSLHFNALAGVIACEYRHKSCISRKLDSCGYNPVAEIIALTTFK